MEKENMNNLANIKNVMFHIGIHKTGTTFLQEEVFPKIKRAIFARSKINVEEVISAKKESLIVSYESLSGRPWGSTNGGEMMEEERKYKGKKEGKIKSIKRRTWMEDFKYYVKKYPSPFQKQK